MAFQYDFLGGSVPQNTYLLRCPKCITPLTYQKKLIIIPPDPPPFYNTRPETYAIDETDWITADDGSIIVADDGSPVIKQIVNPDGTPAQPGNIATESGDTIVTGDGQNIIFDIPNVDYPQYGDKNSTQGDET